MGYELDCTEIQRHAELYFQIDHFVQKLSCFMTRPMYELYSEKTCLVTCAVVKVLDQAKSISAAFQDFAACLRLLGIQGLS